MQDIFTQILAFARDAYHALPPLYWAAAAVGILVVIIILWLVIRRPKPTAMDTAQSPSADADLPEPDRAPTTPEAPARSLQENDTPLAPPASSPAPQASVKRVAAEVSPPQTTARPHPMQPTDRIGLMKRLKSGLTKTRQLLTGDIDALFHGDAKNDEALFESLEELLITADIGVETTMELITRLSNKGRQTQSADSLKSALKSEILDIIKPAQPPVLTSGNRPHVIMVVGVNGVGKTTTIGKLAARYTSQGKKVLIAAADTFRAAAVEQVVVWARRSGADIVKHKEGSDPAAVAYDSIEAALARGVDVVLIDTAGRLHTKINLMAELQKIKRATAKKLPGAPHEILLTLDATTGQNALSQAKLFDEAMGITAIALTKVDGTAKGGIVVSICRDLNAELKYIGVGENIEDLQDFEAKAFVNALF